MAKGYVDPNFSNPMGPGDATIIIYGYRPSLVVAILGLVLFGFSFIFHLFQVLRYRTWYFIPVALGTAMEIVGYVFRYFSSQKDPYLIIYFVIQYFFIVVAPVFFSASIYTILSIMIERWGKQYSPVPTKFVLWTFISCDVIATIVQVAGAALIGVRESNEQDATSANNILLAGLAFQVFDFFIFILCMSAFLWRAREIWIMSPVYKRFVTALSVATLLIYLRTTFRLAETAQGLLQELSTHEVYFGCLEFAPVALAVIIFNIWHPGRILGRRTQQGLSEQPNMAEV